MKSGSCEGTYTVSPHSANFTSAPTTQETYRGGLGFQGSERKSSSWRRSSMGSSGVVDEAVVIQVSETAETLAGSEMQIIVQVGALK